MLLELRLKINHPSITALTHIFDNIEGRAVALKNANANLQL